MAKAENKVVADYKKKVEAQKKELAKFTDALKERRGELLAELKEIDNALGITPKPERSASMGAPGSTIRWGSKNNTFIAESVANSDGGISMADLKAAAAKAKLNEMSIYQAARSLVKAEGLVEEGGLLKAGPNFPASK